MLVVYTILLCFSCWVFLTGLPKALTNISYDFLKSQDEYLIRAKVIKLNEYLDFPLTSKINEDGVRDSANDMGNGIIYTDKVGLQGLVTFHEAEF